MKILDFLKKGKNVGDFVRFLQTHANFGKKFLQKFSVSLSQIFTYKGNC